MRQAVPEAARRIGVSEAEITAYFKVIRRTLDQSDLDGQDRFLKEYGRYFGDESACSYWDTPGSELGPVMKGRAAG